ncbi:MAG: transposase, partial [Nitrospira sp.]|nr:transposase [Nitrospira sp.]
SAGGDSSWPQALMVVLFDIANRLALDARVVSCRPSEKIVARGLLDGLSDEHLLLLDTGFYGIPFLSAVADTGARFLCPVPRHVRFRDCGKKRRQGAVLEYRAFMHARLRLPNGGTRVARMEVRVIEVESPGHRTRRFVTNLPESIPATEVVLIYPERWREEMAFDEIKTVLCHGPAGGAPIPLRSKAPKAVA